MERKLVSVQEIRKLTPIENADKIEVASILGWSAVVQKGQFREGDKVVYFEIDAFLPVLPEFEFLRANCYKRFDDGREGFRIRTRRLRGQISQGLVMPLSILPHGAYDVGQDVSAIVGVSKYEPPMPKCLVGLAKGKFPIGIPKTDEPRVQLLQAVLTRHVGVTCYATEKLDGTSLTIFVKDGEFGVASRNLELKESDNAYWRWVRENNAEQKLKATGRNIALQGELCGVGVQGNPLGINGLGVWFFNAFDIDACRYLSFAEFKELVVLLGFQTVPMVIELFQLTDDVEALVQMSIGKSAINSNVWREGIVVRPVAERLDLGMALSSFANNGRLSFKVINPEYLLDVEL